MSTKDITVAALWISATAIVALIAAGWRKTARATADPARALIPRRRPNWLPVAEADAELYHHTPLWRRIWAVVASSLLSVIVGAAVATVIGFGLAYAVITLTHMLKR